MYGTYYCTHSVGPIIHISGLRPVSVVGMESTLNQRSLELGRKGAAFGMFAYRSILAGNVPVAIPNLRDKAEREKYRNDVKCTDPAVAGDQYIPPYHGGEPDIPDEVYDRARELWLKDLKSDNGYSHAAFNRGESEKK